MMLSIIEAINSFFQLITNLVSNKKKILQLLRAMFLKKTITHLFHMITMQ